MADQGDTDTLEFNTPLYASTDSNNAISQNIYWLTNFSVSSPVGSDTLEFSTPLYASTNSNNSVSQNIYWLTNFSLSTPVGSDVLEFTTPLYASTNSSNSVSQNIYWLTNFSTPTLQGVSDDTEFAATGVFESLISALMDEVVNARNAKFVWGS